MNEMDDDVESNLLCIKNFIETFSFSKNSEIVIDQLKLKEIHLKYNENNNSNVINIYSSYCIWLCMNEIYPSWFDISIHPAQFDTEIEAYECLLKYINEYHENKYNNITKNIFDNLKNIKPTDFVDIYSLIILAALVADNKQTYINNILSLDHKTQKFIHNIVEYLDQETTSNEKNTYSPLETSNSLSYNQKIIEETETLKNEIKQLKEKVKSVELENENLNNTINEKDKIIEKNKIDIEDLNKQINSMKSKCSNENFILQIEEQEKKINELQINLENEIKEKTNMQNEFMNKIKELEDEQNILKQENLNIEELQNKIDKYKQKLENFVTIQNINKELEKKHQEHTQKMIDMEIEMEKIKKESENIEKYKDKCADLDANLVNIRKENEKLKQNLSEKNKAYEKLKKELNDKIISYEMLKKEKSNDQYNNILGNVDQTEELIRAKKEIENLKKQLESNTNIKSNNVNDLENEIDDLKRINEKLENKISDLIKTENNDDVSYHEQYITLLKESEIKQKKIDDLTETNQKMLLQIANFQQNNDSSLNEKIIKLESELLLQKNNNLQIEEITKNKLNKEFNAVLQILKEQLQIREKENDYYKETLKNQIEVLNDEQKLLSGIIHNLGLKYKQLQIYNLSLKNEIAGIKLRKEACETQK